MLVSAFAGREAVLRAYANAVAERCRFSYGDYVDSLVPHWSAAASGCCGRTQSSTRRPAFNSADSSHFIGVAALAPGIHTELTFVYASHAWLQCTCTSGSATLQTYFMPFARAASINCIVVDRIKLVPLSSRNFGAATPRTFSVSSAIAAAYMDRTVATTASLSAGPLHNSWAMALIDPSAKSSPSPTRINAASSFTSL